MPAVCAENFHEILYTQKSVSPVRMTAAIPPHIRGFSGIRSFTHQKTTGFSSLLHFPCEPSFFPFLIDSFSLILSWKKQTPTLYVGVCFHFEGVFHAPVLALTVKAGPTMIPWNPLISRMRGFIAQDRPIVSAIFAAGRSAKPSKSSWLGMGRFKNTRFPIAILSSSLL